MFVKKSGKSVFGADLTADERKALEIEARRQLAEYTRKHVLEIESMIIRQVRRRTGWGALRLKRFYESFDEDIYDLINRYEMRDVDAPWLCTMELMEEGFDIEAWHRELHPNEKYTVESNK